MSDILVIAVCAVICGAEGWEDIEEYGKAQAGWFEHILDLPHGIPCDDTFRRVLSRLNPEEFTQCFISWTRALSDLSDGDLVAIDGKTLRHSFDRASSKAAMHMVSAWAHANRLVLGQTKVDDKSNEITAIPELITYRRFKRSFSAPLPVGVFWKLAAAAARRAGRRRHGLRCSGRH